MNPLFPVLARAAAFGAVIGIGVECGAEFEVKGEIFALSVVVCIAL